MTIRNEWDQADNQIEEEKEGPLARCVRCPSCYLLPDLLDDGGSFVLVCERHGHMARGNSVQETKEHWNKYVQFIKKETKS